MAYSVTFNEHLANPQNGGELENANATGEESNPVCGDRLRLSLRIEDGRIIVARFLAYGCPPTIVCGSMLTTLLPGKSVAEAAQFSRAELIDAVGGLPSRKRHAAALAIETLRKTLANAAPH